MSLPAEDAHDPRDAPDTSVPAAASSELDWRVLYDALGERVFRMLHRMTDDRGLAEDLTHDTFLRVHESRRQYDGAGTVGAWVFRIAGNLARDELRRRTMRANRTPEFYIGRDHVPRTDHELRLTLQDALARLDTDQRAVVLLHDVDGYTHAEIAAMLDIREGTSRARLSRARDTLRAALRPDLEIPE